MASRDRSRMLERQRLNRWSKLKYHEPAQILRGLRTLEIELTSVEMDERVRRLRTPGLKQYREWRDAALFLYGLGLEQGRDIQYATLEEEDYDFVARWPDSATFHFCPVQLKELPPGDLNSKANLEQIIAGSTKDPRPTSTVLAVRLNKAGSIDLDGVRISSVPWRQIWFFWASAPNSSRWTVYGDALSNPGRFSFDYPI